ncbi:MAG: hypothetical protein ACYDC4_15595 [Candidatus Dormibacteria bacterium]
MPFSMSWWARHFHDADVIEIILDFQMGAERSPWGSLDVALAGVPQSADLRGELAAVTMWSGEVFAHGDRWWNTMRRASRSCTG